MVNKGGVVKHSDLAGLRAALVAELGRARGTAMESGDTLTSTVSRESAAYDAGRVAGLEQAIEILDRGTPWLAR